MASDLRNEIKSYIVRSGCTMQEVVDLLADEHGWSDSVSNLSNKLQRESLRYTEAVQLAVKVAQADYIENAGGMSAEIAARGANLSGGQRQRLLIARALAGAPEILILDDSSSALDYKTDALMRAGVREHFDDTTTIIIAQRVSSVRSCDKILVLENGVPSGLGTHEELLSSCQLYREIYTLQMGEGE